METIWKYEFYVRDMFDLHIPFGGTILDVQVQGNTPFMWVLVDTNQPLVRRRFRIFGTGNPFDLDNDYGWGYVGTFQVPPFVWHLFEDYSVEE
jgi:hypothetical protein